MKPVTCRLPPGVDRRACSTGAAPATCAGLVGLTVLHGHAGGGGEPVDGAHGTDGAERLPARGLGHRAAPTPSCGYGCVAQPAAGRERLHHHRARSPTSSAPRARARPLPRHSGAPGPHHAGVGRGGRPVEADGEAILRFSAARRWFCGRIRNHDAAKFFGFFFYFHAIWRKGPAKLSPTNPEKPPAESLAVFLHLRKRP